MTAPIIIRISKTRLQDINRYGDIRHFLSVHGMDTRTMACREEGEELVYEGQRKVAAK